MEYEITCHVSLWKEQAQFCCKAFKGTKAAAPQHCSDWKTALGNSDTCPEGYSMIQGNVFENSREILWRNCKSSKVKGEGEEIFITRDPERERTTGKRCKSGSLSYSLKPEKQRCQMWSHPAHSPQTSSASSAACPGDGTQTSSPQVLGSHPDRDGQHWDTTLMFPSTSSF